MIFSLQFCRNLLVRVCNASIFIFLIKTNIITFRNSDEGWKFLMLNDNRKYALDHSHLASEDEKTKLKVKK